MSVSKELQNWSVMVCKMKAIYHTLNFFNMDVSKKCLIGECWIPVKDIDTVQKALNDAVRIFHYKFYFYVGTSSNFSH